MPYALIIDIVVAILLVVTIVYAVGLNRRLRAMRRDRSKLEKIANDFAKSTARANDSITHLKTANETLQRQLDSAQSLRDDLSYLLDRGEKTADRLEDLVRTARDKVGISPVAGVGGETIDEAADASTAAVAETPAAPESGSGGSGADPNSGDAEQALLRAIRSTG